MKKEVVEQRGSSWAAFEEDERAIFESNGRRRGVPYNVAREEVIGGEDLEGGSGANVNGGGEQAHPAWEDGTFQTGTIRGGEVHMGSTVGSGSTAPTTQTSNVNGGLTDEELSRQLKERLGELDDDDHRNGDHGDDGLHL